MVTEPNSRLDSWKEIAEYLRRDTRTVMRWEKERGLPVHRVPGGTRHGVFAYRAEIDAWIQGQPTAILEANAVASTKAGHRWPLELAGLAVLALGAYGLNGWMLNTHARQPERVTMSPTLLAALDQSGNPLWSHPIQAWREISLSEQAFRHAVADLDGDGLREVLVSPPTQFRQGLPDNTEKLLCYSSRGELLWSYEPKNVLRFGGTVYEGP